mmetsp:Transcript_12424/g.52235  ORF Transcript_12424/g.52235 Transcript_12424/m.52235 type:complete len:358 (-) Transcript_12424:6625-7698(-)
MHTARAVGQRLLKRLVDHHTVMRGGRIDSQYRLTLGQSGRGSRSTAESVGCAGTPTRTPAGRPAVKQQVRVSLPRLLEQARVRATPRDAAVQRSQTYAERLSGELPNTFAPRANEIQQARPHALPISLLPSTRRPALGKHAQHMEASKRVVQSTLTLAVAGGTVWVDFCCRALVCHRGCTKVPQREVGPQTELHSPRTHERPQEHDSVTQRAIGAAFGGPCGAAGKDHEFAGFLARAGLGAQQLSRSNSFQPCDGRNKAVAHKIIQVQTTGALALRARGRGRRRQHCARAWAEDPPAVPRHHSRRAKKGLRHEQASVQGRGGCIHDLGHRRNPPRPGRLATSRLGAVARRHTLDDQT